MKTELTRDEAERLPSIRDKWLKVGLKTRIDQPIDAAWSGIKLAYRTAGRPEPKIHIWMESPLRGVLACAAFAQVNDQVGDQVRAQVNDQVSDQVNAQVNAQVGDQVWAQVSDQVWAQVRAQVSDQVGAQVSDQVGAQVRAFSSRMWRDPGQFDCHWLAFYDALREFCDISKLAGLMQVAENCSYVWMFPDIVVFSASPTRIHRDNRNRLHCEDGQAIGWSDGFGLWRWHGVAVPELVIMRPHEITVEMISKEQNSEIRRVMIDRYGPARYLVDSGAKKIQEDEWGSLYRKEVPGDEPILMVKVVNSTAEPDGSYKDYWLRVHPECRPLLADGTFGNPQMLTARNAVASTFGMVGADYSPLVQT